MKDETYVMVINDIFEDVKQQGGSFVRCHPVEHLTKIRCKEDILNKITHNEEITSRFQLNIIRINRWWWSVAFIDKNEIDENSRTILDT